MEERDFRTMQFSAAEIAPESPDIGKIYKEVYRAPADATVKTAPGEGITVLPHVTGVDFDTDAVTQWLEEGDTPELSLPLTYTQPKITQEALSIALFRDELSSFKTSFSGSSQNRSNNIALCSGAVNETVLLPGQSFSFNATVGERTPERGYLEAGAYVGGKLVESVGGGICQVSSTLYNAVLLADLKITDRSNHSMTVGYVRTGLDATVNWGTIDFAFENTREYPIKIRMWTEGTTLFAVIVGTKTNDYTVTIRREILSQTPRETVVTVNPNLAPGTTVTVEAGHDGSSVQTYRVVTDGAGNVISSTPEAKSTYRRVNKQIESGPDPVSAANPSPPPVPPEPATPPAQSGEGGGTDIPSEDPPGQETPNVQI
jgi:vancomycin resistance protein YoaR